MKLLPVQVDVNAQFTTWSEEVRAVTVSMESEEQ